MHLLCCLNKHAWGVAAQPGITRVIRACTRPGCMAYQAVSLPKDSTTPFDLATAKWGPTLMRAAHSCHHGREHLPESAVPPNTLGSAGGWHGGDPGFDIASPEGRVRLQDMLPQGSKSSVQVEESSPDAYEVPCHGKDTQFQEYLMATTRVLRDLSATLKETLEYEKVRQAYKDQIFAHIAESIAQLGTCCRLKVGCVLLAKNGRVVGMGYNGAGPGMPHCDPETCNAECRCGRTLHAEQNALFARSGDPYVAYVTAEPCLNCTKELALAGIRRVVYQRPYTSIAPNERDDRQEWINHYRIEWQQLPGGDE